MYYYALTIRKPSGTRTLAQANRVFDDIEFYFRSLKKKRADMDIRFHYECVEHLNGHLNIHAHAFVCSRKTVDYTEVTFKKPYRVFFEECRSQLAWNVYITKDRDTRTKIVERVIRIESAGAGAPLGCDEDTHKISTKLISDDIPSDDEIRVMRIIKNVNLFNLVKA